MRHLILTLALVLGAIGAGAQSMSQPARGVPSARLAVTLPDNPTTGARVFVEKGCARCHALGGDNRRMGPDLGRVRLPGSVLDLAGAFWNHAPVMREKMIDLKIARPEFNDSEMADLLAFLTAYRYYLTEVGGAGNPLVGREVFRQKRCPSCHGNREAWNLPGPSLERYRGHVSPIVLAQAMWNHGPEMAALMRRLGVPFPQFDGRELGDLLAFLQAGTIAADERVYVEPGSPRRGRELFTAKRCISCHMVAGEGGHGGPDLGAPERNMMRPVTAIAGSMWNHSRGMAAEFARRGIPPVRFSGQEMADIIAYLYFVNYAGVSGTPSRGQQVFNNRCAVCHSGGAAAIGPDLRVAPRLNDPVAIFTAMWNHAPRMEQELRRVGVAWPRLAPGDAADLVAFLLMPRTTAIPAMPGAPR